MGAWKMNGDIGRIDPDFDTIIKECIKQLKIKFPNYGNTWLEQDDKHYKERIKKEVNEYIDSMSIDSERRKLLNIINLAAMAYQTAHVNRADRRISARCPKCSKPLTLHNIKDGFFVCLD